jgi:hypothetical protein
VSDGGVHAHFTRHGWARCNGLFSRAEAGAMAGWVDELVALPDRPGGVWKYGDDEARTQGRAILSRIERFREHHAGLRAVLEDARLSSLLSALMGEPPLLFKDKINLKLPGSSGFALHQDAQAGWQAYGRVQVTVMISIDATTRENGCLEIGAGPRLTELRGALFRPLCEAEVADVPFVPVETAPGDVVVFDSFVAHRSAPNRTQTARRVLYATYNPRSDGDQYARYFADKHASYPPDVERHRDHDYRYRV